MLNVLILEDDSSFLKVLEIRLRSWQPDINIITSDSIASAREILDKSDISYDLVIFDQHLPDGLGSELFDHPKLETAAVLAVSSDTSPDMPASTVKAGAQHFLGKRQVTEALFIPLVEAMIARRSVEKELQASREKQVVLETVKVLISTLRHEINNPLGAVLGGTYLLQNVGTLEKDQQEALELIEASGKRIKHVIAELCEAVELEKLEKGREEVFHIPGDKPWEGSKK